MNYRLTWLNHWSTQRETADPRVLIRYTEMDDGWYEHEYIYYFMAGNDAEAKQKALEYIRQSDETIDIFSVYNRQTKKTILTEEAQL